jgi:hypothetical protein
MAIYNNVIRIVIFHEGLTCTARYRRHVKMTITDGRPLPPPASGHRQPGFWVELRDDAHNTLYWATMWRPFTHTIETTTPDGQLGHAGHADPRGVFDVIVPDIQGAHEIVLFSSSIDVGEELEPARQIFAAEIQSITKVT